MARSLYLTAPHYMAPLNTLQTYLIRYSLETGWGPQPTSFKPQAASVKQQALDIVLYIGYCRMINQLMEDTCLKDMQVIRLSSLRTGKNLQDQYLSKAQQPIRWTPLSSGTPSSTLLLSSLSKIFRILTSIGVNPKLSNNTPAARIAWLATFPKPQATSRKLQAPKLFVYGFERQATSVKLQAASDKLQDTRAFIKFFISVRVTRN